MPNNRNEARGTRRPRTIVDGRPRGWWWADDALIDDGHMAYMGASAFAVLCCLIRHADRNGQAFPSVRGLIDETALSRNTVQRSIKGLVSLGYLRRLSVGGWRVDPETRRRRNFSSVYVVLGRDHWPAPPRRGGPIIDPPPPGGVAPLSTHGGAPVGPPWCTGGAPVAPPVHTKDNTGKDNTGKDDVDVAGLFSGSADPAAVALLLAEGFGRADAEGLAARVGRVEVVAIVAHADGMAAAGTLRDRRAFIAAAIVKGYGMAGRAVPRYRATERSADRTARLLASRHKTPDAHDDYAIPSGRGGVTAATRPEREKVSTEFDEPGLELPQI